MNIFNNDFKDFILYLNQYEVEYIVVGGYAVIIRGYSRSTGDIDIWVNKTEENFIKLLKAIKAFGLLE
jgi:predicted nucleotidyltransferase